MIKISNLLKRSIGNNAGYTSDNLKKFRNNVEVATYNVGIYETKYTTASRSYNERPNLSNKNILQTEYDALHASKMLLNQAKEDLSVFEEERARYNLGQKTSVSTPVQIKKMKF